MSSNITAVATRLGAMATDEVAPKAFSTGSKGFFGSGKITVEGVRYQAQVSAILVGSNKDEKAKVKASLADVSARLVPFIEENLTERGAAKPFSSGKTGFHGQGKITVDGQTFQVGVQAVKLA